MYDSYEAAEDARFYLKSKSPITRVENWETCCKCYKQVLSNRALTKFKVLDPGGAAKKKKHYFCSLACFTEVMGVEKDD